MYSEDRQLCHFSQQSSLKDYFCEIIDGPHCMYITKVLEETETNGIFGSEIVERLYLCRIFSKNKVCRNFVEHIKIISDSKWCMQNLPYGHSSWC